jgi:DNA-binding SARP family transcriptional activator
MAQLHLRLLGGFAARLDDGRAVRLPFRRAQALLAFLALSPGPAHPRDQLTTLLWSDLPRSDAYARLRHTLFLLRRALADGRFEGLDVTGDAVRLRPSTVRVDALEFERLAGLASPTALARAGALYQGDLLLGLAASDDLFEEWLSARRARLREQAIEVLGRLLRHQRNGGRGEAAVRTALRLLELDPLQEAIHRALMELYRGLGRRGAALCQYRACEAVLRRELGVEPDAETTALYHDIARAGGTGEPGPAGVQPERERLRHALGESVASLHRAGTRDWQRGAFAQGQPLLETALRALESLPPTGEALARSVDLRLLLHRCLNPLGAVGQSRENLQAAELAATRLNDPRRLALVSLYLSEQYRASGDLAGSAERASHALSLAQDAGAAGLEVEANFQLGETRWLRGNPRDGVACLHVAVASTADWPMERRVGYPVVPSLVYLARALTSLGEFARAEGYAGQAMAIAEVAQHPLSLSEGLHALGGLYAEQGDAGRAIPLLERSLAVLHEHQIGHIEPLVTVLLGYAFALAGDREKAAPLLKRSLVDRAGAIRLVGARAAAGLVLVGDLEAGGRAAAEALAAARRCGAVLHESNALVQLAAVSAQGSPTHWPEAERSYTAALDRAVMLGARPLVAHCHLGLGMLFWRMGRPRPGRERLTTAAKMYRELAMAEWQRRAEAELTGHSVRQSLPGLDKHE